MIKIIFLYKNNVSDSPRIISEVEIKPLEKDPNYPQQLEKEINNVIIKENDWNKYKTEKLEVYQHDSLKKFKSELLEDSKTIDINQLKLDLNFDHHLPKNRKITSNHSSIADKKEAQTIKSNENNNSKGSGNHVKICSIEDNKIFCFF